MTVGIAGQSERLGDLCGLLALRLDRGSPQGDFAQPFLFIGRLHSCCLHSCPHLSLLGKLLATTLGMQLSTPCRVLSGWIMFQHLARMQEFMILCCLVEQRYELVACWVINRMITSSGEPVLDMR